MEELKSIGIEIIYDRTLEKESLKDAMEELQPDVLVVRSTKVSPSIVDADPKLQLVVRAGAGFDTIDFTHCSRKGIYVANCPGKNAHAVAELTMGIIVNIDRRMSEGYALLKDGKWNKPLFSTCKGLKDRTIGLIGFGNISQLVCKLAKAFEMDVLVHTRTKYPALAKQMGF